MYFRGAHAQRKNRKYELRSFIVDTVYHGLSHWISNNGWPV
jgi:hypothetical protein